MKFLSIVAVCLVSIAAVTATSGIANAYQGLDLGRDCRSSNEASVARCEGFISGFVAGAQMDVSGQPINMWRAYGYSWCGPTVFAHSEIVDALFDANRSGQATPHFPAAVMLAQSLAAAYPCGESSAPGFPNRGFPKLGSPSSDPEQ